MPTQKIVREWRDVYASGIARAVYAGRETNSHASVSWAHYVAEKPLSGTTPEPPPTTRRKWKR